MKKKYLKTCISVLAVTAVLLSACGGPQQKNVGKTTMETAKLADSIRKKYNEISSIHTGELLNRITSDVSVLVSSIISIVPNMVYFIVKLVGVFVVLFAIDKTFSLVFVFGGALMFVVVLLFKSKMKTLHKAVQESDGKTRSFFQEIFSSLLVVKVFGAENKVSENAMNLQQNNFKINEKEIISL